MYIFVVTGSTCRSKKEQLLLGYGSITWDKAGRVGSRKQLGVSITFSSGLPVFL